MQCLPWAIPFPSERAEWASLRRDESCLQAHVGTLGAGSPILLGCNEQHTSPMWFSKNVVFLTWGSHVWARDPESTLLTGKIPTASASM